MADVLHMELLPFGIGVSVLFPPNTDTEGFKEELRTMPDEVENGGILIKIMFSGP